MRRFGLAALILCVLVIATPTNVFCLGDALFVIGSRELDDDAEPAEKQTAFGISVFLRGETWPVAAMFGIQTSNDEASLFDPMIGPFTFEAGVEELYFGVGKIWDRRPSVRPYIAGGLTILRLDLKLTDSFGLGPSDDDTTVSPYVEGGVFWRVGRSFNIGISARFVVLAEVEPFDIEGDADYAQYNGLVGWGW